MNSRQRAIIMERDSWQCALTGLRYSLTVHHCYSRQVIKGVKSDELYHQVLTINDVVHVTYLEQSSRDKQLVYIEQLIADKKGNLRILESTRSFLMQGYTLKQIAKIYAMKFKGQETEEYLQECEKEQVAYTARKGLKKEVRRKSKEFWKEKLSNQKN